MKRVRLIHSLLLIGVMLFTSLAAFAGPSTSRSPNRQKSATVAEKLSSKKRVTRSRRSRRASAYRKSARYRGRRRRFFERFSTSSYADDVTLGDITDGEDPIVRAAAVEALGNMNGTVVAVDPNSGRILAMVNQKLALSAGAQPCSTIKIPVALAALNENLINKDTIIRVGRRTRIDLTKAMATSNNTYFEVIGRQLGFDKVSYYAHQFGLGELAGYDIEGEQLAAFPGEALSSKRGGVGRMCSYGEGIAVTPLQLAALTAALANGGTLYYLQHPRSPEEMTNFEPRIKRQLDLLPLIPDISEGLVGAVEYGTARPLRHSFMEAPVLGKTGTCSNNGTRFGWFNSYANTQYGKIVLVVFLRGGRPTYGPKAAEIAGRIYRTLYDHSFFAATPASSSEPAIGVSQ
jgi:penicillin-binding protein 2